MSDELLQEGTSDFLLIEGTSDALLQEVLGDQPGPPTGVAALKGNSSAAVSATAPAYSGTSAITGYTATSSPGGFTATGSLPLIVTGLTNGTSYTFTVHATNISGNSIESDPSSAVVPSAAPGAPIGVTASGSGPVTVNFFAPPSNGGDAITTYRATSNTGATAFSDSSPITVSGLVPGTYTFTVAAANANGYGPESALTSSVTFTSYLLTAVVLAPFVSSDGAVASPGYTLVQIIGGTAAAIGGRVTSNIAPLPGTYNGYAASISVLQNQADGSFKGLIKWDTGETTFTGNRTSGSAAISGIADTTDFKIGQGVSGNGIPSSATIQSIDSSSQITLTVSATSGSGSSTLLTRATYVWDQLSIQPLTTSTFAGFDWTTFVSTSGGKLYAAGDGSDATHTKIPTLDLPSSDVRGTTLTLYTSTGNPLWGVLADDWDNFTKTATHGTVQTIADSNHFVAQFFTPKATSDLNNIPGVRLERVRTTVLGGTGFSGDPVHAAS